MTKFLGLDFKTTKDTFIPRPETGLLVKASLDIMPRDKARILDIGTGTGNIAISLTKADRVCKIVALDKSEEALAIAKENAKHLGVSDRIKFIKSDLFSDLAIEPFDIIVSNPPYIPDWEIPTLADYVKDEPRLALDGGEDGLGFYKKIIEAAPKFLKEGGFLIMEMGYSQSYHVKRLLRESGNFTDIEILKDYSNIDRVIRARRWIS